ncbi:MAG: hypothetical protein SGILL_010499 [Bacillariaceae sp.]
MAASTFASMLDEASKKVIEGSHKSIASLWDEWYGLGEYADSFGGIEGREKTFKTKWRYKLHYRDRCRFSRNRRIVRAVKKLATDRQITLQESIDDMEARYATCNKSIGLLIIALQEEGTLPWATNRNPLLPPDQHSEKPVQIGMQADDCRVCKENWKRKKKNNPKMNQQEIRKHGVLRRTSLGCPKCGIRVCRECWPTYKHDLRPRCMDCMRSYQDKRIKDAENCPGAAPGGKCNRET